MIGKGGATISLSLALAFGAFACPQLARATSPQSNQTNTASRSTNSQAWNSGNSQSTTTNQAQASKEAEQMVPATADLKKELDAKKIHSGQNFQAVLQHDVQLKNGPKLNGGTVLLGKVISDKTSDGHTRLSLRFTQAKMKNGQTVPIKATIVQFAKPEGMVGTGTNLANQSGLWTPKTLRVDQIGAISDADLHSAIASRNSAVLVSKKDDIKLNAGDQMEIVIAPRGDNMRNGA